MKHLITLTGTIPEHIGLKSRPRAKHRRRFVYR